MCIIIKHVENCDKSHHFFDRIIIYIYIFLQEMLRIQSPGYAAQNGGLDIWGGKKKKRKELIQPDPVINRRDLKWLDLGGDLIRLFLFRLIFLYINIQHFIYYICNVKILKSRFEVFRPFGFRVATADRPSPLRKPGLWRGISDLAQVLHLTEPSVSIRAWDRRWS